MTESPTTILAFWFESLTPAEWFSQNDEVDAEIVRRFSGIHRQASQCELYDWREDPEGRLAEIIVLDQFSRNIFRNSAKAFACDPLALALAQEAVAMGADQRLAPQQRGFLYLPYMHSESAVIHEIAVRLFDQPGLELNLDFEHKHKAIIDRFGRYPHRNEVLGRTSTDDELAFLSEHGAGF